jgi:alkanesulfonate monooxygenase SsuD/methylene tetrahydromethanopterin reductase-like flavin-dependent oxidoreductase (luciferase family)
MRLSIFSVVDHYPERERSVAELYDQLIAQCAIAEHHFHQYGAVPDPAVLLPVLAMRTRRIRLGPAVAVLPFRHPVEVAESYAMIDVLSHGRLVLGVGFGYLQHEFAGFGINPAEKRARFDEALAIVTRLLQGERVTHAGRFHTLDDVALNIAPAQKPHPPIYLAILRKEAAYHVGRSGHRIMSIPYASTERFEDVEPMVDAFRRGRADAGLATLADDAIFAFHCHVADSDQAARAGAAEAFDRYVATRLYARRQTYDDILESGLGLFGSVDGVAAKLDRLRQWGIGHVALLMDFGLMPADAVSRSMTLMAREVAPRVRSRIEARERPSPA